MRIKLDIVGDLAEQMREVTTDGERAVYLPRPRVEIGGPQGVQATFDWQAAKDSVVGRMCTVG